MIELLKFVYGQLSVLGHGVYDDLPPAGTKYPFIQYTVYEPYRNNNPELYTLTVDIWDRNNGTFRVETVTSEVDAILENLYYNNECISATVKRQSRQPVGDPDQEIKRRQLNYQIRLFDICKGEK